MPTETLEDSPPLPNTLTGSDFTNEQAWIEAGVMRRGQPSPGLPALAERKTLPALAERKTLFGPLPATERRFTIDWVDGHREATEPPDPTYPDGCAIDVALDAPQACRVELPWPAAGRGLWVVTCLKCGFAIALATAGRADDPRSVRVGCKR